MFCNALCNLHAPHFKSYHLTHVFNCAPHLCLYSPDTSLNPAQIDVGLRPRLCHLRKWADFAGYGFDLQSEKGTTGQYIGRVDYGSPAMVTGLRSGDHIVEVNGQNVEHASHADVVRRVMSRPAEVSMLLVDDLTAKLHEKKGIPLDGNLESILELHCPEEKPGRLYNKWMIMILHIYC